MSRGVIDVALGERSYAIHVGSGLLADPSAWESLHGATRVALVTNTVVARLYLGPLTQTLTGLGVAIVPIVLPDGEAHKDWQTLNTIFDALLAARCDRGTPIVALGGGVVGDMAGFAAAVYQRGVPFVQVPTTLLAQVDSSVGGKTAINHPLGKNMIGAFWQPRAVIADTDTLATLPDREFSAGLAEVIKYGLICDAEFFAWLESNIERLRARDAAALAHAIKRSCEIKADIVRRDERETSIRAWLNLGHTFGHAIEAAQGYGAWLHGEAVGAGLVLAATLSHALGHIDERDVARIRALVAKAGCPVDPPALSFDDWITHMSVDKKVERGKLRFILLKRIGEAYIDGDVPRDTLRSVLQA